MTVYIYIGDIVILKLYFFHNIKVIYETVYRAIWEPPVGWSAAICDMIRCDVTRCDAMRYTLIPTRENILYPIFHSLTHHFYQQFLFLYEKKKKRNFKNKQNFSKFFKLINFLTSRKKGEIQNSLNWSIFSLWKKEKIQNSLHWSISSLWKEGKMNNSLNWSILLTLKEEKKKKLKIPSSSSLRFHERV